MGWIVDTAERLLPHKCHPPSLPAPALAPTAPGSPIPSTPSPTYERLRDTIARRMRMSHVYQPLMLMELLGRCSPAPAQDVARRILGEDVTQIEYYTERVKRMVGKVLTGNGITRYDQGAYDLVGGVAEGFCAGPSFSKRSSGAERRRARPAAGAVPPTPWRFPRAAKRNGNQPHLSRNEVDHHIATERIGVAAKG